MDKLKRWLHWRGIAAKDLIFGVGALGFLLCSLSLLIYISIAACQLQ
jgi:hypothetical protein